MDATDATATTKKEKTRKQAYHDGPVWAEAITLLARIVPQNDNGALIGGGGATAGAGRAGAPREGVDYD